MAEKCVASRRQISRRQTLEFAPLRAVPRDNQLTGYAVPNGLKCPQQAANIFFGAQACHGSDNRSLSMNLESRIMPLRKPRDVYTIWNIANPIRRKSPPVKRKLVKRARRQHNRTVREYKATRKHAARQLTICLFRSKSILNMDVAHNLRPVGDGPLDGAPIISNQQIGIALAQDFETRGCSIARSVSARSHQPLRIDVVCKSSLAVINAVQSNNCVPIFWPEVICECSEACLRSAHCKCREHM